MWYLLYEVLFFLKFKVTQDETAITNLCNFSHSTDKREGRDARHILAFSKLCVQVRNQSIHFSRCSFYMPDFFSINGKNKNPNNYKESQEILNFFINISVYIASPFSSRIKDLFGKGGRKTVNSHWWWMTLRK